VFCLPTRFEPLGVVFLEAMFYGIPCIGSDHWAVPEMIVDRQTGYVVPTDDVDLLAQRLVDLLTDGELARTLGEAGRTRAQMLFTWKRVVERMLAVLKAAPLAREMV
jgi:glycosyltransferase involved in cell wall biosynthesis